jgi:hypothetical protein
LDARIKESFTERKSLRHHPALHHHPLLTPYLPMKNQELINWEQEFETRFNRRHSQLTHLGDKETKRHCDTCKEDREKNPKGYYLTYLNEQKCYWNRELYDEVKDFIRTLLSTQAKASLESFILILETLRLSSLKDEVDSITRDQYENLVVAGLNQRIDKIISSLTQDPTN